MFFGIERRVSTTQSEYFSVNNVYLNGVRIAAVNSECRALFYHTDQVDSVKVVTDDGGLPVTHTEYLPYGEVLAEEGNECNRPKFNSQALDKESGFYFFNARHYDSSIARFVTADSVVDGEYSLAGWNRYMYCGGNPVLYKDPSGHRKKNIKTQVFGEPVGDRSLSSSDKAHSIGSVKRMDARMARNARDLGANKAANVAEGKAGIAHLINEGVATYNDYTLGSKLEQNKKQAINNIVVYALNKGLKNALKNKSLKGFNMDTVIERAMSIMSKQIRNKKTMFSVHKPNSLKYYVLRLDCNNEKNQIRLKGILKMPIGKDNREYIENIVDKFFSNNLQSIQNKTKKQTLFFNDLKKIHSGLQSGVNNYKKQWMYHKSTQIDNYINTYTPPNNLKYYEETYNK